MHTYIEMQQRCLAACMCPEDESHVGEHLQDAVDIVGDGGDLVLRATSSSVESPGFLAAYSAHVIRPSAARRQGDDGAGDETGEQTDETESEAASVERWTGTGAVDPAAQAIRSLQARTLKIRVKDEHTMAHYRRQHVTS